MPRGVKLGHGASASGLEISPTYTRRRERERERSRAINPRATEMRLVCTSVTLSRSRGVEETRGDLFFARDKQRLGSRTESNLRLGSRLPTCLNSLSFSNFSFFQAAALYRRIPPRMGLLSNFNTSHAFVFYFLLLKYRCASIDRRSWIRELKWSKIVTSSLDRFTFPAATLPEVSCHLKSQVHS